MRSVFRHLTSTRVSSVPHNDQYLATDTTLTVGVETERQYACWNAGKKFFTTSGVRSLILKHCLASLSMYIKLMSVVFIEAIISTTVKLSILRTLIASNCIDTCILCGGYIHCRMPLPTPPGAEPLVM